jgi:tetratricopeptide (TPR) repeat protein
MQLPPLTSLSLLRRINCVRSLTRIQLAASIVCAALLLCVPAIHAQATKQDTTPGWPLHDSSPNHATADVGGAIPLLIEDDVSCLLWSTGKNSAPSVSAANLKAPQAARDEYKKACTELHARRLPDAEQHVRKAIEIDPDYPGALALLGQLLEANQKILEAKSACSRASTVDAAYAPAYLCLSDLAAQQSDWRGSLNFADRALALDPVQNCFGHFYSAIAQVHLGAIAAAETSALDAIEADHAHRVPQAHLLLAQIYGSQNELDRAAEQLRAYLKVAHNAPDAPAVKKSLADVEARMQK